MGVPLQPFEQGVQQGAGNGELIHGVGQGAIHGFGQGIAGVDAVEPVPEAGDGVVLAVLHVNGVVRQAAEAIERIGAFTDPFGQQQGGCVEGP